MTLEEFQETVRGIMAEVTTMTLATCAGGVPWATDVYFAPDGFDLVFFSSPNSRHCRNLADNPASAVTIHPAVASWQDIKGLQMAGTGETITSIAARAHAFAAYFRKFPFTRDLFKEPGSSIKSFAQVTAHVFRPSYIRFIDNSQGFGARFGLSLQDGEPIGLPAREGRG